MDNQGPNNYNYNNGPGNNGSGGNGNNGGNRSGGNGGRNNRGGQGIMAFILLSIVYLVGRTYGYQLSGFEMIAAYGFGWVLGLLADYVKIMATGRA